jgi:Fur family zinc uptake transcriptional regulator
MSTCQDHHHCQHQALTKAEEICAERGLRLTPQRRQVLTLIWQSHRPMKAYDLLEQMQQDDPSAKPPTVYRALDFLMEQGLIHRLDSLNAFTGCGHPDGHHRDCYFMICQDCGTASEYCAPALSQAIHQAAQDNDFSPQQTVLEIAGTCGDCRAD